MVTKKSTKTSKKIQKQKIAQDKKYSISGMITGIIGFLFSWIPVFGLIMSIVGLGLSVYMIFAKRQANAKTFLGFVFGLLGVILGVILSVLFWLFAGLNTHVFMK
jgi:hypothetical protein